jgi:hypothetical protein
MTDFPDQAGSRLTSDDHEVETHHEFRANLPLLLARNGRACARRLQPSVERLAQGRLHRMTRWALAPVYFAVESSMIKHRTVSLWLLVAAVACGLCRAEGQDSGVKVNPLREAYYGDLHLHTSYSLDAYLLGTTQIDPDAAYHFARGDVVIYLGQPVRRREPLDFLAVTDHAESIGVLSELENPNSVVSRSETGKALRALFARLTGSNGRRDFTSALKEPALMEQVVAITRDYYGGRTNKLPSDLKAESAAAWGREIDFANRNYQPGKFTTFIAYEWTAAPNGANLHRNVIFRGDSAPYPFTALDSKEPQDLWTWLKDIRKQGFEALAIPHNGNASNGLMYDWISGPEYMDRDYAVDRQANEPLSEISQTKGASETHPLLSPNDEFADYEIFDVYEQVRRQVGRPQGSYLRDALSGGLVLERQLGTNPFKYGFVGGSDLHSGLSVSAQSDYGGSVLAINQGGGKPTSEQVARGLASAGGNVAGFSLKTTTGGLTGVWAESNTRGAIYSALRRRETFATTGTRLKFRFFAGWNFKKSLLQERNWIADAYANGVPMGGDLPAKPSEAKVPTFAIWAIKDPNGANLDRVQVIKVWEEDGKQKERVFDVAWSGERKPDPKSGRLPSVGNTIDISTGKYSNSIGASELKAIWNDPEFDPLRFTAYYLRVLEIPTPRWSSLLAIEHGLTLPIDPPAAEQQRGWSSPIWFSPKGDRVH